VNPPGLFGRRMTTRMRMGDVAVYSIRFGGITCSIAEDPNLKKPYHWQIEAWTCRCALSGDEKTMPRAVKKLERAIAEWHHMCSEVLPEVVRLPQHGVLTAREFVAQVAMLRMAIAQKYSVLVWSQDGSLPNGVAA
jgi:hypothetical protein